MRVHPAPILLPQYRCSFMTTRLRSSSSRDDDDDGDVDEDDENDHHQRPRGVYDPTVSDQIVRARRLLDVARNKQKAREVAMAMSVSVNVGNGEDGLTMISTTTASTASKTHLPFFAMVTNDAAAATVVASDIVHKSKKIKSTTSSGSIIADGESMTQISHSEPWARRSLSDMFVREARTDYDGNVIVVQGCEEGEENMDKVGSVLADRDVVASIWNLRKTLQNEDFNKVFDSRNRFIGDLD